VSSIDFKDVKAGYAVGGGVEAAGGGWSKLEYFYIDSVD
jgi:hypothetical protein